MKIKLIIEKMKSFFNRLAWPVWYFAGALILLFVTSTHLIDFALVKIELNWMAWAWLFMGFAIWAFKKVKK